MSNNILSIKIEIPGLELLAQAVMKLAEQKGAAVKVTDTDPATAAAHEMTAPASVSVTATPTAPQNMPGVAPVQPVPQNMPVASVPVAAAPTVPQSVVPVAQAMPQSVVPTASVPVAPQITAPAAPTQIPTTAVPITHTYDELAVAASQLVNMGKQVRLREILSGFGVNSLMELVPEKYAAFAGCLKAEGVKF